ncbi:MAG TPA: glycoside hydrolase family 2 protein, partial [archaeon]|nr:glycoside hydrolase family 2 protein [archaeon]
FTLYSQLNQGEALKTAITHWRSCMFKTSGCLIWQLNDCWPAISWSIIDYGLNPKPAYYYTKRAFQPIIAPLIVKHDKIYAYIVNETEKTLKSIFKFQIISFNGETIHFEQIETVTPPYTSNLVLERALSGVPLRDDCFFFATLESDGTILCEDTRTIQEPKYLKLPAPRIEVKVTKVGSCKFHVQLESDVYSKAAWLNIDGHKAKFDDNFFDIIPQRPKAVEILLEKDIDVNDFKKSLVLKVYPYL